MGERNTAMHNELHSPKIHPYLALAIGAVALSTAAVLVKMTAAPAAVVAFYRMFFSFLIMTPMIVLFYRSEWRVLDRRDWLFCTLSGLFLGMHFILWFESLQYTSVASSVVLVTLQPLFTFVGGYLFFKENVGWKALLGGTLAICGAIVICWGDVQIGGMALFGNALALAGAVMVSAYWLVGQRVRRKISMMMYTYIVYGFSALFIFLYVLVSEETLSGFEMKTWLIFIALAIFPTLLGHSIFNWGAALGECVRHFRDRLVRTGWGSRSGVCDSERKFAMDPVAWRNVDPVWDLCVYSPTRCDGKKRVIGETDDRYLRESEETE